ncbi:ribosomal protein L11/L12 [Kipferlia bialata]|uniref:Ribosomal protein L11/L12 n=1 Tax=Kipferlia bialata TaxID=797122 RepID=A0A9K3GIN3_9EUKA|nr:ribosomal protein L11/L12 [Kipferlia bialata]|eukprot:g5887.t1
MAPADPNTVVNVVLRVIGGEVVQVAKISQKLGPMGVNTRAIAGDLTKAVEDWPGIRVTVNVAILNRQGTVSIIPTASSLVIKALNEPKRNRKEEEMTHDGTVPFDAICSIAKQIHHKSYAMELAGTVKSVLGSCVSVGCSILVDGETMCPQDVIEMIQDGDLTVPDLE